MYDDVFTILKAVFGGILVLFLIVFIVVVVSFKIELASSEKVEMDGVFEFVDFNVTASSVQNAPAIVIKTYTAYVTVNGVEHNVEISFEKYKVLKKLDIGTKVIVVFGTVNDIYYPVDVKLK